MTQPQFKICLIGCSPSSGSTYFADLLDSTMHSVAGPEIGFFADPNLYREKNHNFLSQKSTATPSPHSSGVGIYEKFLPGYGLNKEQLFDLAFASDNSIDFVNKFTQRYIAFREKKHPVLFCEKTPQNVFIAEKFLERFTNGHFIYITRNPINVISSLKKRGYSDYIATLTWLVATAAFISIENKPRVKLVKYESLLKKPYLIVSETLSSILNILVSPKEIEAYYTTNSYRTVCEARLASWSAQSVGKIKPTSPLHLNKAEKGFFKYITKCEISKHYSDLCGIPQITFAEALSRLGYEKEYYDVTDGAADCFDEKNFKPKYNEKKMMLGKWLKMKAWKTNLLSINDFIMPLKYEQ